MTRAEPGDLGELSRSLRDIRLDAGLTLEQAAERTGFSLSKISRMERGLTVPSPRDIAELLQAYPRAGEAVGALVRMAADAKASSRRIVWSKPPNRALFQDRLRRLDLAHHRITEFSPTFVPGLVQTEQYARAIFEPSGISASEINRAVRHRMARQEILTDPRRQVTVLLIEGALLGLHVLDPEAMAAQVSHIAALTQTTRARIGVIPFGVKAPTFAPTAAWTVWDEEVVVPSVLATQVVLNPPHTAPYLAQLAEYQRLAVYDARAREVLARVARRWLAARE